MKKKILIMAIAASLLALTVAGTSIAYFTDTEEYTNVFTTGNVEINLTEAVVAADAVGNLVATSTRTTINDTPAEKDYGKIFPSQTIYKDPTIHNIGSEEAYVGAIIYIESTVFNSIVADDQIDEFITGLNTNATITYVKTTNGYTLYVLFENAIAANADTGALFTGIKVFDDWDNEEMAELKDLEIVINAYATQVSGFGTGNALTALQTAFEGTDWDNYSSTALPVNP